MQNKVEYLAKAFVSRSLRKEDEKFTAFVANILHYFRIEPFGTIGGFENKAEPLGLSIRNNIEKADFIVIVATKRFFTKDAHTEIKSTSMSELIHVESGIAYAFNKPIVVFVEQGTNVGTFLPGVTQYIVLDGTQDNLRSQHGLITSLLNDALAKADQIKRNVYWKSLKDFSVKALAVYAGLKIIDGFIDENSDI